MPKNLTASDRKSLIRLASTMEKGSPERKVILAGLGVIEDQDGTLYSPTGKRLPLLRDLPTPKAVVVHPDFGGFSLTSAGKRMFEEITGGDKFDSYDTPRHHPALLWLANNEAKDAFRSKIKVIPVSGDYEIREYDGREWVVTPNDIRWQNTGSW